MRSSSFSPSSSLRFSARSFSAVVAVLCLGVFGAACAEDAAPEPQNPGGVGDAGAGGSGGSSGSGGSDAGSAGSAAAPTLPDVAGCTLAGSVDGTAGAQEVTIPAGQFAYSPPCLKVKVGTIVTFTGASGLHPLAPMTKGTTDGNPIPSSVEASIPVTFTAEGAFPYFCTNHGTDGGTSGMVGAVYVVP
jgi:plastocyanin